MAQGSPKAEIDITEALVRGLLAAQCPQWADLPLRLLANGFDNVNYRLGDDLLVRVPRRALAEPLLVHEQQFLAPLAPHLPLPIPAPLYAGQPEGDYPWHWSVLPFLQGEELAQSHIDADEAVTFAEFLAALHAIPLPNDPPINAIRGCPINVREETITDRLKRLGAETDLITPRIVKLYEDALSVPKRERNLWVHGDLHGRNILVQNGKLSAIIDWGDICSGDPASDLSGLLMAFPDAHNDPQVRAALPHLDDDDFTHALGWVVFYGAILFDTGRVDNPLHATMGQRILAQLDA